MYIVFYGPEGSGKGTQASLVAKKLNIPHLISGDLVRKYAREDKGIIGRICRESLKKGYYVADSKMYVLWRKRFKEPDAKNGWVLDGFPRNLGQAKFLKRKVEKYGQTIDIVFFLQISEKESVRRLLKRGRKNPDGTVHDTPERIKQRLQDYTKGKKAVLDYYEKRGLLIHIDGEPSIEEIHKEIMRKIKETQEKKKKQ